MPSYTVNVELASLPVGNVLITAGASVVNVSVDPVTDAAITAAVAAANMSTYVPVAQVSLRPANLDYTGTTDQASALNTALAEGRQLAPGIVRIDSQVTVPDTVGLVGAGGAIGISGGVTQTIAGTTIRCTTSSAGIEVQGSGGTISGLRIDGNGVATKPLYRFQGSSRLFSDVHVINSAAHNWTIESSQNDEYIGCQSQGAAGRGISLDLGCGGLVFLRFEAWGNTSGGLLVQQSAVTSAPYYTTPTHIAFIHSILEHQAADVPAAEASAGDKILFSHCVLVGENSSGAVSPILKLTNGAHATIHNVRFAINNSPTSQNVISLASSAQLTIQGRNDILGVGASDLDAASGTRVYIEGELVNGSHTGIVFGSNTVSDGDTSVFANRSTPTFTTRPSSSDYAERTATNSDAGIRFERRIDGTLGWTDGTTFTRDTILSRFGSAILGLTGSFRPATTDTYTLGINTIQWLRAYVRTLVSPQVTQTLAANGAVTINSASGDAAITLQANATSSSITGSPVNGQLLTITWIQDSTGGRTYAWPTNCKFAGSAPSDTTLSKRTSVTFRFDGTNWYEESRAVAVG